MAASVDDTGHADLGGDWDLEYASGTIEAGIPFSVQLQQNWFSVLDIQTFQEGTASYTGTVDTQLLQGSPDTSSGADTTITVDLSTGGGEAQACSDSV